MKAPHHSGRFAKASTDVRAAANHNPLTLCWSCKRTLPHHTPHRDGKPATWQAGHTRFGSQTYSVWTSACITPTQCDTIAAGDWLAPQASTCNNGMKGDTATPIPAVITTRNW